MTVETLEILFKPPITTRKTKTVRTTAVITVVTVYSAPKIFTVCFASGSKTLFTAVEIPFT